jgi:hypothetical protein
MSSRFVPHALTTLLAMLMLVRASEPAAAFTPAEGKTPMTVTLVRSDAADCGTHCAEWLALTGLIVPGTPALLRAALDHLGHRSVPVLVDSPGGSVEAAMAMGKMIRARKLDVIVAGTALTDCGKADRPCLARRSTGERPGYVAGGVAACASACPLVLAAGTERSVGPNSYVGVHQMVTRRTFNRVFNLFRVVRRVVGGHVVEVSRTLISTRPVSSRTVQSTAPEQLYSEVDRYLLGMGIGESIMPLMRSAAPTGIHWMAPAELAMTRIATDTTQAAILVARSAEPGPAVPKEATVAPQAATLTLGNGRWWNGTVAWRIDHAPTAAKNAPMLLGAIDIPGRNLHGTLSLARNTDPAKGANFILTISVVAPPDAGGAELATVGQPKFCDGETCTGPAIPARFGRLAADDAVFWITAAEDSFLTALHDRTWLVLPITLRDGSTGNIGLSLSDPEHKAIADWQHLCCGMALPDRKADVKVPSPPAPSATRAQSTSPVRRGAAQSS